MKGILQMAGRACAALQRLPFADELHLPDLPHLLIPLLFLLCGFAALCLCAFALRAIFLRSEHHDYAAFLQHVRFFR